MQNNNNPFIVAVEGRLPLSFTQVGDYLEATLNDPGRYILYG